MPWKIVEQDGKHCVVAEDTGKTVTCHDSPAEAAAHMKALYANVPDAKESTRAMYFAEPVSLRESELDAEAFVARNVTLIRPGFSSNVDKAGRPRYYSPDVLKQAAAVFEGTRAYRNHPRRSDETDLPERDIRDLVGYYQNVRTAADGSVVGDLKIIGEARDWMWPLVIETKVKPDLVELSINALGQTRIGEAEGRKAVVIESIVKANSVDVVTTGAAGGSFAGALLQSDADGWTGDLLAAMSFEQWREARPEYLDKLKAEWKTARDAQAVKDVKAKLDEATQTITRLTEANRAEQGELADYRRAATADRLLSESALPHSLRPAIRKELIAAADEAGMQAVLAREAVKYQAAPKAPVPVNGAGQRPPSAAVPAVPPVKPNLLGISEARFVKPGESVTDYAARMKQLREKA